MISSTARDLPEHREQVKEACLRLGMLPSMMEHLPASDADAVAESLRMVNEADIYLGIFAFRYGHVPEGRDISITEMEYNRADERGIPCLIFLMREDYSGLKVSDVDRGEGAIKLEALKERLRKEKVVSSFALPEDLSGKVIQSLSQYRKPDLTAFHYVSDIPAPPAAYIAHPYTLLHARGLIGRQDELNLLTDWVTKQDSEIYKTRILNIVAIGGMGKSALTWKWFNDIAPQEMKPLAGRMWWSFYESDARFENFIPRALAYVTNQPREEVQKIPLPEAEEKLLAVLDREPFLLVLDGLERLLIAYARMDAARLQDSDLDEQTANFIASERGLPPSAAQSFTGQQQLRKTADPRVGSFLRKLTRTSASRILVSTRLYPRDLQDKYTDEPIPGSAANFPLKLNDNDAIDLWRTFDVGGSREDLLTLFHTFNNHPLLIKALAGEIKRYKRTPGDFEKWRRDHPKFDPSSFPAIAETQAHVLEYALRGLDESSLKVLQTIAAFRMPATYDTLTALFVGKRKAKFDLRTGKLVTEEGKLFDVETNLVASLTDLEERGLLGWNKLANRYDLHPIVRGVVWSSLREDERRVVYMSLGAHFGAMPMMGDFLKVSSLEDLTPAIELYNTLIGLERYDDASVVFRDLLSDATLYRLSASRYRVELLELLFPDGLEQLPPLSSSAPQSYILNALAQGYRYSGQPGRAASLFRRASVMSLEMKRADNFNTNLSNLSDTLRQSGALYESEIAGRRALVISREQNALFQLAVNLYLLGLTLAVRGIADESEYALQQAMKVFVAQSMSQAEGMGHSFLAQRALWLSKIDIALSFSNRAWELAHVLNLERDFIHAARLQGEVALELNDVATADERLHHALTRARMVNHVEEELPALVALAELRRRQRDLKAARELLDDVWEALERGRSPSFTLMLTMCWRKLSGMMVIK